MSLDFNLIPVSTLAWAIGPAPERDLGYNPATIQP
jgi:hypothetical protein